MNDLGTALANAGLGTGFAADTEKQKLGEKIAALAPQSIPHLMTMKGFGFCDRVKNIIGFLEEDPLVIDDAIAAVRKHMFGGQPGKDLYQHLLQFKHGQLSIGELKEKWKNVLNPALKRC